MSRAKSFDFFPPESAVKGIKLVLSLCVCLCVCLSWPQGCCWLLGVSKYPLIGYFFGYLGKYYSYNLAKYCSNSVFAIAYCNSRVKFICQSLAGVLSSTSSLFWCAVKVVRYQKGLSELCHAKTCLNKSLFCPPPVKDLNVCFNMTWIWPNAVVVISVGSLTMQNEAILTGHLFSHYRHR